MVATLQVGNEAKERGEGMEKKEGEREGRKGKVVGRGEETSRSSAGCTVFSFRFTSLVERSAGCIPQETQRCRNKEQRERERGVERERENNTAPL